MILIIMTISNYKGKQKNPYTLIATTMKYYIARRININILYFYIKLCLFSIAIVSAEIVYSVKRLNL